MPALRRTIRLLLLVILLVAGIFITLLLMPTTHQGIPSKLTQKTRQGWLNLVIRSLGIQPQITGLPTEQSALWVANHISWADIPVIGALAPVSFLSKAEIKSWPIIGWLANQTGTLFIERGNPESSNKAMSLIRRHIENMHSILIFPEGTTTEGRSVKKFYPRLFAPAMDGNLIIQPVALRYERENGERHDKIPFVEQQPFFSNLWSIMGEKRIVARVSFLPTLRAADFKERRGVAKRAHGLVAEAVYRHLQARKSGP